MYFYKRNLLKSPPENNDLNVEVQCESLAVK